MHVAVVALLLIRLAAIRSTISLVVIIRCTALRSAAALISLVVVGWVIHIGAVAKL